MKVIVEGLTESILTLNKIGVPIQGRVTAILDINTNEQQQELNIVVKAGLVKILKESECVKNTEEEKNASNKDANPEGRGKGKRKSGRPKGSKGKSKINQEKEGAARAEAETQKEGSTVVIGTGGDTVKGKMTHNAVGEQPESDRTKKSLEAMEKLQEEEENENAEGFDPQDMTIDESKLDPSEQIGREAIIGTGSGEQKVKMTNSSVPEADAIRQMDPFIDREDKKEIETVEKAQENAKEKDSKEKTATTIAKVPEKIDEEVSADIKKLDDGSDADDYSDAFVEI